MRKEPKYPYFCGGAAFICSVILLSYVMPPVPCFSFEIPENNSRAEYLYVFGPRGNPYDGADNADNQQEIFINVPAETVERLIVEVYDPDTGGFRDQRPDPQHKWDTSVEFSLYGAGEAPLESKVFGEAPEYDKRYYMFGPFDKGQGRKNGGFYQFKLAASALEGEDQNLFNVRIFPDGAEAFSYRISFRLLPHEGDKMFFYPEIPAGTTEIFVENYDLDPKGGSASLKDPLNGKVYEVDCSGSGRWASTPVKVAPSAHPRRLVYTVVKKTQQYANAALRVRDGNGNALPVYFKKSGPVVIADYRVPESPAVPARKCNSFTFDASGSYDPDNGILSYFWDFGDGTTSSEPVVTHEYKKGGVYTVRLRVKNASGLECDSASSSREVKVSTPPQADFTAPQIVCAGNAVSFDAGKTTDDTPGTLTYEWDFGDGTGGEGRTVSKTYSKGGQYTVRLYVDDNSGSPCSKGTMSRNITVNSPPVANAGSDVNMCFTARQEMKLEFNGSRSYDPDGDGLFYEWDFGDGGTASGAVVSHTFRKFGEFTVNLTVNDGRGSSCSTARDTLIVRLNSRPVANAGAEMVACVGREVVFDGSGSEGEGLKYTWNLADGNKKEGMRVTHTYSKGGYYTPVLMVDDGKSNHCSVSSSALNLFVNTPPEVILANEPAVCLGETVQFDAFAKDADGDELTYTWDFGDGTVIKGGASKTHVYAEGGVYTVKVTVDDNRGTPCSGVSAVSAVKINCRPVADAGPNLVCCLNKKAVFDASGSHDPDGDELKYYWDFGDGASAAGVKVTHAYVRSGEYTVTLKVDDGSGTPCSWSSASFQAKVSDRPVSVIKVK